MNLEFKWNDNQMRCKLEKINLFFGGNLTGKSELAQLFEEGFSGKIQGFEVDYQQVKKKEYEVILCTSNSSIDEELKLTSKTILSKEIKKILSDSDFSFDLNEQLIKTVEQLNTRLNERWEELGLSKSVSFHGQFDFQDLSKFIKNQYQFYNEDVNLFDSKFRYYQLCSKYLSECKNGILIIDDFDNYLDLFNCLTLLETFEASNIIYLIFVKSAELCTHCINKYPIYLMCNKLKKYNEYYYSIIESYTIDENLNNCILYTQKEEIEQNQIQYYIYHQVILQSLCMMNFDEKKFLKNGFILPDFIINSVKNGKNV